MNLKPWTALFFAISLCACGDDDAADAADAADADATLDDAGDFDAADGSHDTSLDSTVQEDAAIDAADDALVDAARDAMDAGSDADDASCGDTSSNPDQCGDCDTVCPERPGATRVCTDGVCGYVCVDSRLDCDEDASNGCEASSRSFSNCGSCGNACVDPPGGFGLCSVEGECAIMCTSGFADCDGDTVNGCEQDVSDDLLNCGGCEVVCAPVPNATATCESSACAFDCDEGRGDCNDDAADGCEQSVSSDPMNCGACGNVCDVGTTCAGGECRELVAFVSSIPLPVPGGELAAMGDPLLIAQDHCNDLADAAGLPGSFDAWFSTSTSSPADRFPRDVPWNTLEGARIADDWADLTDGRLTTLILDDENGDRVPAVADYMGTRIGYSCRTGGTIDQYNVLTGTRANGTGGGTCTDYTSTSSLALVGSTLRGDSVTPGRWTEASCVLAESCAVRLWRVYCFEQPAD